MDFVVGIIFDFVFTVMAQRQTAAHLLCCHGVHFISVVFDVRFVERSMTWELHMSA